MKRGSARVVRFAATAALAAACAAGFCACSADDGAADEITDPIIDVYDISGGVAATVNGVEIGENALTAYIENFRATEGLEDDDDWGTWLIENGYTIDSLRGETRDLYVNQELIWQAADELGLSVTKFAVKQRVQEAIDLAGGDEDWEEALEEMGMTEEAYTYYVELTLLQEKMQEELSADVVAADEDVLEYIQTYEEDYADVTSLDEVDEDTVANYRAYADSLAQEAYFSEWMNDFKDASEIHEESLPEGMSYDIDLTEYEEAYYAALEEETSGDSDEEADEEE